MEVVETNEIKYSCKLGVLSRPDGSAIFCQGKYNFMYLNNHSFTVTQKSIYLFFEFII